ncbi:MAG: hypothetical protein GF411_14150 [Candidatus Lokiarchaeota archaeon]|nr:hypothetical protein [Candidatus Lokiarchaeota archaeon]
MGFKADVHIKCDKDGIVNPTIRMIDRLKNKCQYIMRVTQDTIIDFDEFIKTFDEVDGTDNFICGGKASLNNIQMERTKGRANALGISISDGRDYVQGNVMLAPTRVWLEYYYRVAQVVKHYGDDSLLSRIANKNGIELRFVEKFWQHKHIKVDRVNIKKPLIASFPRSGTHFLINTIKDNFIDVDNGWVDVVHGVKHRWVKDVKPDGSNLSEKIREQLIKYGESPVRKPLKTHYQFYFLERHWDVIKELYDVFYIIRDPRDVMAACFNYYNKTNFEIFIKEKNFSKFLRHELWNAHSETQPFSFSLVKPRNIVDKWNKHVHSWMTFVNRGVTLIKFEDLNQNPTRVINHIENETSQNKINDKIKIVDINDKRYRPDYEGDNPRGIGCWKHYFNLDDIDWLYGGINFAQIYTNTTAENQTAHNIH